MKTRYSIEVIDRGRDEGVGTERTLARESDLDAAHALYKFCARQFPERVILLTDRARVLARSDCS
jgi:hypothetical protein